MSWELCNILIIIFYNLIICYSFNLANIKNQMNKRKLQINQVKKATLRGKKQKTITTKYQVALSFFKQKDQKNTKIFSISLEPLIVDLLEQLSNVQLAYKLENQIKQEIIPVQIVADQQIKFQTQTMKYISKEFPIDQIMKCISIKKDPKCHQITLQIIKSKLMLFFKHIRSIYPQFCFCVGQKVIVQNYDLKSFYQVFKIQWAKVNERGRLRTIQKIQKSICRALYFIGALVQNNIFQQIQEQQRKKKQQNTDLGTKSEKKRNVKGISQQVSSTYSFGSNDMLSNFSYGLKSQQSNQQDYFKSGYSQKSQKIIRKQRCFLFEKVEIKNLKVKLPIDHQSINQEQAKFQIDLLSNDVQNILIEQAFKIQKLKDACQRNKFDTLGYYPYEVYMNMGMNVNLNPNMGVNMNYYNSVYPPPYSYQQQMQNYQNSYIHPNLVSEDSDIYNIRRNFNTINLVQTRKTHSRMGGNKYS